MKPIVFLLLIVTPFVARSEFTIATQGQAQCAISQDADATEPEKHAAGELAETLKLITGAEFAIRAADSAKEERMIIVGPGQTARKLFPKINFEELGPEETVIESNDKVLLLAGGRPRGTLYAVSRFLQDQCGVRWWTPWAGRIPANRDLRVTTLSMRAKPAFEMREPFWYPAFDHLWAVRNRCNGQSANIPAEWGGCIRYKGFVHTFNPLVPPNKHFAEHPEWFSLIKGKRTAERAQLCLTNPKLRDFTVERVKQWLRESPEVSILSVSQNDWHGACECSDCKSIDDAEGSHAGTLMSFINYIAEKIEPDFPNIAIDTLAYQYTRKPPRTIKPRPSVIVRLCSIECNFREPLDHASNSSFAEDIKGWARICQRLYIWDYTTDFSHYVQPHPNWFTLGDNVRFFQQHNVRGVFEQGAYQSHGSEMAELRAWVLAQLLWNPRQDERALIREFLEGYYGAEAARPIGRYLELLYDASRGHNLTCNSRTDAPFLSFRHLAEAEKLWQQAQQAATNNLALLTRVRVAHLPVRYVWLSRWQALRKECQEQNGAWPLAESRKNVAEEWRKVAEGISGLPWTKVTLLNEAGLKPDQFLGRFVEDAPN
jgi:hypothetical protein